jgi:hypothetical protein
VSRSSPEQHHDSSDEILPAEFLTDSDPGLNFATVNNSGSPRLMSILSLSRFHGATLVKDQRAAKINTVAKLIKIPVGILNLRHRLGTAEVIRQNPG